ncbi:unnamed protein product [Closterium sp. NIES-65]|nr:unnamed protein product [Closterium sp. NIES-65]
MGARADEARSELLRVRRDIHTVEEQLARATHELDEAAKAGDRERVDDHRRMRNCLWKEKEQLRIQETIFLKIAFADFPAPNMMASPGSHAFSSPALPSPLHLQHQAQMAPHTAQLGPPPFNNPPLGGSSLSGSPSLMGACDPALTPLHTATLMPGASPPDCFSLGGPSPSPLQTPLSGPGGAMGMGAQGGGGHFTSTGMSAGQSLLGMLPTSPAMRPASGTPASGNGGRIGRRRSAMSPGLAPMQSGAMLMGGDMGEMANPEGYEVSRNLDARVEDVWREWKEGLNGGPSIEKLEEARRRDRKCVWWRHKNDYKYWRKQYRSRPCFPLPSCLFPLSPPFPVSPHDHLPSPCLRRPGFSSHAAGGGGRAGQMRIVHAVESKAGEFAGDVAAAIRFWDDILRVEFAGSISKLREALGGDRPLPSAQSTGGGGGGNGADDSPGAEGRGEDGREGSGEGNDGGGVGGGEGSKWKRQRRELLQRGVERMKAWAQGGASGAAVGGSALMAAALAPAGVGGVCADGGMVGGMGGGQGSMAGAVVDGMGTPMGMQAGMAQQTQMNGGNGSSGMGAHVVSSHEMGVVQGVLMQHGGGNGMQQHGGGNGMQQHGGGNGMQQHGGGNGMQQQGGEQHMVGGHGDGSVMQGHVQQHVMQGSGPQHGQSGMVQQI